MILVLGGTTEGRRAVVTLDKAGSRFYYSTRSDLQKVESTNAERITGGLDAGSMKSFCLDNHIRLIIDAAHPFATALHATAFRTAKELSIPLVRYERKYPPRDKRLIWCEDFEDAIVKLQENGIKRLLALTGVQTIDRLRNYWKEHECRFRILNREESLTKAKEAGFDQSGLVFYEKDGDISDLLVEFKPDGILTKESGESGGFSLKTQEALAKGIKVFVVERPALPHSDKTVTGEYGLRKAVEHLAPGFFQLRSGFTTGACATAAAKAALLSLVEDEEPTEVSFTIPDGEEMTLPVENFRIIDSQTAEATVIKDAGDDPDVTDGCRIVARVKLANHGDTHFFGGEGIGRVTLPGTGLEIGQPAINPVPRQMMHNELSAIYPRGCDVTISVPGGEELAKKTFNSRIGIEGGISIIGTSGIVMPFSNEAFLECIRREMEVAEAAGVERVVLNSGARSEKAVGALYPNLPAAAFIHYGNAIGESLQIAHDMKIKRLTVGIMLGKAVKLAEGHSDTHSHKVTMNRDFLKNLAEEAGCGKRVSATIDRLNMARELWEALSTEESDLFFPHLLSKCMLTCRNHYPDGDLTLMLISDDGKVKYKLR